jgi:hypothetical protein
MFMGNRKHPTTLNLTEYKSLQRELWWQRYVGWLKQECVGEFRWMASRHLMFSSINAKKQANHPRKNYFSASKKIEIYQSFNHCDTSRLFFLLKKT